MNHLKEYSESMERVKKYFPDGKPKFNTNKIGVIGKIGVEGYYPEATDEGKWVGHLIADDLQLAEAGARIIESRGWKVRIVKIDTENINRY